MNVTKSKAIAILVAVVVSVSVATSLATNYVSNKHHAGSFDTYSDQTVSPYTKFASATNAMETNFTVAADLSIHAVVHVKTKGQIRQQQQMFNDPLFDFFFGPQQQQQLQQQRKSQQENVPLGIGSGVIISKDGYIVTNNHVIKNANEIEVTLNDKRSFKAKLVGTDPSTDIALLKIDADNLPTIVFGNSDDMKVGEWVLAVGNPFNLTSTVTAGIVSAKARDIGIIKENNDSEETGAISIESFIQTDAAINPGNSGGALVNTRGELIGINTAIASQTGQYAGYGFAVPSSIVKKVVTDLREHGSVQRALLGVQICDIDTDIAKEKGIKTLEGALVNEIVAEGAAEKAGIKTNDVINEVNGVKVKSKAELQEQVSRYRPGDKVTIGLVRDNKQMTLTANLKNAEGTSEIVNSSNYNTDLGATLKPVDTKIKRALGIDYGLEVQSVTNGKFASAGIKQGYIILKINNNPMSSTNDFKNVCDESMKSSDKKLYIAGVYPMTGKVAYYEVKLGK